MKTLEGPIAAPNPHAVYKKQQPPRHGKKWLRPFGCLCRQRTSDASPMCGTCLKPQSGCCKRRRTFQQQRIQPLLQGRTPGHVRSGRSDTALQVRSLKRPYRSPKGAGKVSGRCRNSCAAFHKVRPGSTPSHKAHVPSLHLMVIFCKHRQFSTCFGPIVKGLGHGALA